jgi:drug/metabolite transporter (DMT)-like permease
MKWFAVVCALIVALCWGLYGPTLTNARSTARPPEWGPFKPYLFIGVAYVVIAIIGGSIMMKFVFNDNFDYSGKYFPSMQWGFLAGCLGAFGALGLTFALTKAGGKPAYVMPIVFGGAVTVNAIAAYFSLHAGETVNPLMWVGMLLVTLGICLTAGFTPHGHTPVKTPATGSSQSAGDEQPGGKATPKAESQPDDR